MVKDSTLVMTGASEGNGIEYDGYTLLRVNISGGTKGANASGSATIQDSYIHGQYEGPYSHVDGVYVAGSNITIVHNNIENPHGQTDCILVDPKRGYVPDNILVQNNLFNGGGFPAYPGHENGYATPTNTRWIGNHFGRKFYPQGGYWGPVFPSSTIGITWSGNVWDDNGQPVPTP
jgi:hypothetical protein